MPMKRPGRSVIDASRVIEMEDVLVATIGVALQIGAEAAENLALDLLVFGCGLHDEIGVGQA